MLLSYMHNIILSVFVAYPHAENTEAGGGEPEQEPMPQPEQEPMFQIIMEPIRM